MQTEFPFVEVTKKDRGLVGKQDPGKRIYRQGGPAEESGAWYAKLLDRYPGEHFVSPGGVSMFAPVSRAAVYLRINKGKLTCFCYQPTKYSKTLFGNLRKSRQSPYMCVPVSECKAWGAELKERFSDEQTALSSGDFLRLEHSVVDRPKHTGKTSTPKMKRKLAERRKKRG